jgi:type II restriction/modification system DNA methylase subunit YeeA
VSLVGFGTATGQVILDGQPVAAIYTDLTGQTDETGSGFDLTQAKALQENLGVMFMGASKKASLDIPGERARQWLILPNPHGQPNSEVLRPLWNALDVARRPRDMWVVDFGIDMAETNAAFYEAPFQHVLKVVKPEREHNQDPVVRENWWRFGRPRVDMRDALQQLSRYIATPAVAKHRLFIRISNQMLPDQALLVAARSDDTTFGILHSRFHELWALRLGTSLEDRPRYTPTTCFETFPFPAGLTPNLPATEYADNFHAQAIADAARKLNELRESWLNPPQWVDRVPEVVPGYPDRPIPKPEHAAEIKKRTLTNLYNQRPAWLDHAHRALDAAVAAAYGWPADLSDEEVLRRLLALNRARVAER